MNQSFLGWTQFVEMSHIHSKNGLDSTKPFPMFDPVRDEQHPSPFKQVKDMLGGRHEDMKLHAIEGPNTIVFISPVEEFQPLSQDGCNPLVFTFRIAKAVQHTINVAWGVFGNQTTKSNTVTDRNKERVNNLLGSSYARQVGIASASETQCSGNLGTQRGPSVFGDDFGLNTVQTLWENATKNEPGTKFT